MLVDEAELVKCQKKLAAMTEAKNKAVEALKRQLSVAVNINRISNIAFGVPPPVEEPRKILDLRSVIAELESVK